MRGDRPHLWSVLLVGVDRTLDLGGRGWLALAVGIAVGWWFYVPLHELAHAVGCLVAGGEVTRLELAPEYGAVLLARWLSFVAVGSDYAGQLTGFDTRGSDAIYLTTVLAPYLLTLFPGVPVLLASAGRSGVRARLCFGASLPWALAPLLSLPGDYYEAGSILASQMVSWSGRELPAHWRGDDLPLLLTELSAHNQLDATTVLGITAGALIGAALALLTLWLATSLWRHRLRAVLPAS